MTLGYALHLWYHPLDTKKYEECDVSREDNDSVFLGELSGSL